MMTAPKGNCNNDRNGPLNPPLEGMDSIVLIDGRLALFTISPALPVDTFCLLNTRELVCVRTLVTVPAH